MTLARHLKAVHGITADLYREQFPDARIRSEACEANRSAATVRQHARNPRAGKTKEAICPSCKTSHVVGLTASTEATCPTCKNNQKVKVDASKWASLQEGLDYVSCLGCDYRADSLISHITNSHPEWVGCYPGQLVSLNSKIRDKTAIKGVPLTQEVKDKMSLNAGRWNKGLTKDTDLRVRAQSENRKGYPSWAKGYTKETHPSLKASSEKLSLVKIGTRSLTKIVLTLEDFAPFIDSAGLVDRKAMAVALDVCEPTITANMRALGLSLTKKYAQARAERQIIRLEKEVLEAFALGNGKVVIAKVMSALGHDFAVIKRECDRHGLPTFNHRIRQTQCLEAIARILESPYFEEWSPRKYVNPPTGRRFRFDGFFPEYNLVVEFHGYQHWEFPSIYIKKPEVFEALKVRDALKKKLIEAEQGFTYLEIREDEAYDDPDHLTMRLLEAGLFD